jgi:hypothetical protein
MKKFNTMKKITSLLLVSILTTSVFAQINNFAPYCASGYNTNYNMITSMNFNGTNFAGFGATGSYGTQIPSRYFNTTTLNPITSGQTFTLSIVFPSVQDAEPRYFAVWIDFNKNNTFEASELVMQNSNTTNAELVVFQAGASVTATKVITVPANALGGTTRMRIRRSQVEQGSPYAPYDPNVVLTPCAGFTNGFETFGYNCTTDFNVTIQANLSDNEASFNSNFNIFPVPAKELLRIENFSNEKIVNLQIKDIVGKTVYSNITNSTINQIDVSNLAKGIFIITIETENNKTYSTKFIKE